LKNGSAAATTIPDPVGGHTLSAGAVRTGVPAIIAALLLTA